MDHGYIPRCTEFCYDAIRSRLRHWPPQPPEVWLLSRIGFVSNICARYKPQDTTKKLAEMNQCAVIIDSSHPAVSWLFVRPQRRNSSHPQLRNFVS